MKNMAAVILAAGRGTRMNSDVPKALQPLHSRPMLRFVTEVLKRCGVKKQILILGYKAKDIKKIFKGHDYVMQKKLLGSGDAVKRTKGLLARFRGDILVLYGDTPFITAETIRRLVSKHKKDKASSNNNEISQEFTQSLTIPNDVVIAKISSQYVDGVLTVTLPRDEKEANANAKIIKIN